MRSITQQIKYVQQNKKIGLMTHVVAGYPSLQETEQLVLQMEKAGVDFVEIQIPFSDPIADGPTIMMANDKALEKEVRVNDTLALMKRLTKKVQIPLLFMGYYHSIFQYGVEKFCKNAAKAGAQGLIIPDMPIDEEKHEHFLRYCNESNLAAIRILSPTSTNERIAANLKVAQGFIYCTAVSGTTGARSKLDGQTRQFLTKMKRNTQVPLAVGFGISQPEHIQAVIGFADIAVVGSAVIQEIENGGLGKAISLIRRLVEAGE